MFEPAFTYTNRDLIAEYLGMTIEHFNATVGGACIIPAASGKTAVYYYNPFLLAATLKESTLPRTHYGDPIDWQPVLTKNGRTLYRSLDGQPPLTYDKFPRENVVNAVWHLSETEY